MWHAAAAIDPVRLFRRAVGSKPDLWQHELLRSTADRVIVVGCRQAGKSSVLASIALAQALYVPGSMTLLAAPSLEQSSELFAKTVEGWRALGEPLPAERTTVQELRLANGARIRALQASPKTIRGFTADLVLLDEAAYTEDLLFRTISPMLAVTQGRLIAASTPYGRLGWFYDQWSSDDDSWQRIRFTAKDCPRISASFLARERRMLGAAIYAQEYEAEFMDRQYQVFAGDLIESAIDDSIVPLDITSLLAGVKFERVGWQEPAIGDPSLSF